VDVIDGQPDGHGFSPDALLADFTQQRIGTQIKAPAGVSNGHDSGAEEISAFGLTEEAGFAPDDIGAKGPLGGIVH